MIARIKGLKISQASERTAVTGQEMIPFQDGERNGKIRMIEFKDMTMYIFDPTIIDGKVSQEDYDALKQAIEEGKLIYTINSKRNGLDLATEVAIVGGAIYIESPDFIKEEGTDNISQVVFDTITVDGSLNYSKEQYTTTVIKTTGDGTKVLTDNGQYVYIGNLALTNIKFKDGTNTSTYDLVTNGITFRQNATPCVSWNTIKSGNNIYMDIRIANATASMDGLMSKEDYVELNTTIPGQIEDLKEADSNLSNRIDDLDDKIDKEIADREAEIDRIENKFDGVTDKLEEALQKEIEDRKAGDTTITNSLNAFISTKGQPGGLAELDSTGKVPAAQLPSYVDDVLEFSTKAQFPQTGETGKIYVAKDTNLTYRWTGTQYLEISQSLALGETPSTAYSGDKGKANRDALNSMPTKLTSYLTPTTSTGELVKINYKYAAKDGLNYGPLQDDNIDIPSATTTNAGAMSAIDKGRLDDLYNEFGSIQNPGDKLDSLPNNIVTGVDATSRNATSVTINYKQSDLSAASNSYANPITKSQTIPAATQSAAGVMTATDKQNLDVNIPDRITNLDNRVTTEVDRLEELIESSSSEITNDLNVEIQARKDGDTKLQTNINNLQSTMNTELAKKVGKVTVAGSGNAVTTASISGDTLTLTKGATYNNYVHPAGSAPSKSSGFYKFSTDSTSHVASVTAVAKSDITALGIPGQDTTYGNVTQSTSGLMSAADKTKLDGISTGANKYIHPTGEAANKTLGLYKIATDATSHVKQVAAVTKKDITDLGIADTGSTLRLIRIGSKEDYEHVVILLWKDDRGTNRIDGLFYTDMDGSSRRQTAEAHLWFSKWATGSDYKFILNTNQQGLGFSLVTCTYNGAKWWGLRHINDQAVDFYFDGSMSYQINPTVVKYYNRNTSTVLNAEINSSVTNEASKLSRFDVNGDPYAFLSEVNTKVSKSGDTMTGSLRLDRNTGIDTTITTDGNHNVKIGSSVTGGWSRGYNFNNNSGETIGAFGCYGAGQTLNYAYIGSTYNNTWQRWNSSGSVITTPLRIEQTSTTIPLTLIGKNEASYVQFNNGEDSAEVGFHISLGAYLLNDKLATHPSISLGRVDNLDEGATFYYEGKHYKLLHEGNYANELDQRYLPKTVYDYRNGCLVRLRNSASDATMITVRIFGNSYYGNSVPFDTVIQFYNYPPENKIFQATGVNNGYSFGDIKVFNYNNRIYLWFKQPQQYETFIVHAYHNGDLRNMVESISNAAMPTSGVTRTTTITPKQAIYSYDNISVGNVTSSASIRASANMVARYISFNNSDGNNAGYIGSGSPTTNDLYFISQRDNGIHISANNSTTTGGINLTASTNMVSVGAVTATEKLHVVGNIKATNKVYAANGFFKESDARLKSDIKPLDYTLDQICSIPTVSFIMNDQKQIGTIAQNLEELGFEDIVTEGDTLKSEVKNPEQFESFTKDGEEYVKVKKVEYEMLGVLAIEGVKMLKDEIEKLKAEIETLKNKQHE